MMFARSVVHDVTTSWLCVTSHMLMMVVKENLSTEDKGQAKV